MLSHRHALSYLLALLTCLTLAACGGGSEGTVVAIGGATASPNTVERPWGTVKAFPELEKAERPIDADTQFADQMAMHHEQAIELSDILLGHDQPDERITASARFIKQDQTREIGVMKAWLTAWQESLGSDSHSGHDMSMPGMTMPGMVPQEKVDRFAVMEWQDAQIEFLHLMVEHHQGAIDMSHAYLAKGENSFTRSIAQHIIREQMLEISYMNNVIKELCGKSPVDTCK